MPGVDKSERRWLPGDTNGVTDVLVRENVVPGDDNGLEDLFVRDRRTGDVGLVTITVRGEQTDDALGGGTMSADGNHVTFLSFATNLVAQDTDEEGDIFVRDDAGDLR